MTTYNDPILHTGTYTPKVPAVATVMAPLPNVPRLKVDGTGYDWNELNRWLQSIQNLLGSSQGRLNNLYNIVNSLSDNLALNFSDTSSPTFYTVKLTSLSDGRVPYHVSDIVGFADSPIRISSTRVGIGVNPNNTFQVLKLINFNNALYSTFLGYEAGLSTTSGGYDVFIGYGAGKTNTSGQQCVAVGYLALNLSNTHYNTCVGYKAGAVLIGGNSVFIGDSAGILTTGQSGNTAVGSQAQSGGISGAYNTSLGYQAGKSITGENNTCLGASASTSAGESFNVVVGSGAGNTVGSYNTFIGTNSGGSAGASSDRNISIGYYAGSRETGADTLLIDNRLRANEANGRTQSIIYGIMAALPADQYLTFNANVTITGTLTMTGGITVPTLKVTTGAALGSILVSDADGDLTYTAVGTAGTYLAGSATVPTYATLNQAAVAGLTTGSTPTFAGLTLSGLSLSGIVHNSAAGLLSTSAIVNADLGNLGTAGTIPKFGATGLADSLLFETANGIQLYPGKQLLLPATGGFAYDGLFMGDFAGNIYAGLQSLNNVAGNYLYFANGRKFAYLTGWADTTAGMLPGGMFLVLNNTFNFSSFAAGSINPIVRMYLNASGYLGLGTTDSGTTEPESVFQIGKRDASDVVDSPSPYINIIGSNVDTSPERLLRLMRKGHMTGTIQVNATADFNLSSWGAGGAGDEYRGRARLDINLKNDTATYDWTETADEKILSLYSDGRVSLPTDGAILKFGTDEEVALTHIHNVGLGFADSYSLVFGTGNDASIKYDGTNLIINPKLVGTGFLSILGDISLLDEDIILGTTTGTKIGTATNQKLGFYNATPVDQPATVSDPSGGAVVDAEARTAINAIIDRLQELGLIA